MARRAQSYSDFYDVVTAYLKKDDTHGKDKRKVGNEINTELDFGNWYNSVGDELLEASHEEYQYVLHLLPTQPCWPWSNKLTVSFFQAVSRPAPHLTISSPVLD